MSIFHCVGDVCDPGTWYVGRLGEEESTIRVYWFSVGSWKSIFMSGVIWRGWEGVVLWFGGRVRKV